MATSGEGFGDVKTIWIVLQWFFGGLITLIGAAIMALIGNLWKEHRAMKEDFDKRNSDAVKELKAQQKKEYEDVFADVKKLKEDNNELKHKFTQFSNQITPLLKRMEATFDKEDRMYEILKKLEARHGE